MEFYYDFSGQKFGYPLSLSINSFSRTVFSRQTSLEISYVLRGRYEAITSSFSHVMKERDMILIAPYEIHMLKKLDENSIILTLHIDFSRMADSMTGDSRNAFQTAICTETRNRQSYIAIRRKLGSLVSLLMNDRDDIYRMNVLMSEMVWIASKKRNFSMEELPLQTDQRENYLKAIRYIDQHYQEELTLSSIAEQLSFSLSYTSKIMKKYTGIPFVKYLSYVRVRASLEALLEGRDSIEKISEDSGMPSSKAYSSAFKELYGISPSSYRKMFQKNLKYSKEPTEKKMSLEDDQKELLRHLVEEAEENIYESRDIDVRKERDQYLIKLRNSNISIETDSDGNMLLHITGK